MEEPNLHGLNERQADQYELLEQLAEKYGKWDQTTGADGAHYAPASKNPFKDEGLVCENCAFWQEPAGCEIVEGKIEPDAVCKLWIIREDKLGTSDDKPGAAEEPGEA